MQKAQYAGPDSVPAIEAMGLVVSLPDDDAAYIGWPKPPEAEFAVYQQILHGQWVIKRLDVNSFEVFDTEADFADLTDTNYLIKTDAGEPQS